MLGDHVLICTSTCFSGTMPRVGPSRTWSTCDHICHRRKIPHLPSTEASLSGAATLAVHDTRCLCIWDFGICDMLHSSELNIVDWHSRCRALYVSRQPCFATCSQNSVPCISFARTVHMCAHSHCTQRKEHPACTWACEYGGETVALHHSQRFCISDHDTRDMLCSLEVNSVVALISMVS